MIKVDHPGRIIHHLSQEQEYERVTAKDNQEHALRTAILTSRELKRTGRRPNGNRFFYACKPGRIG